MQSCSWNNQESQSVWPDLCGPKPYRAMRPHAICYTNLHRVEWVWVRGRKQDPESISHSVFWGAFGVFQLWSVTMGDLSSTLLSIGIRQTSCLPRDYVNSRLFVALAGWQIPLVFVKEDKGLDA